MTQRRPAFTVNETHLLQTLIDTNANLSYSYIAEILNNAYPSENQGSRSRIGVYEMMRDLKQNDKKNAD